MGHIAERRPSDLHRSSTCLLGTLMLPKRTGKSEGKVGQRVWRCGSVCSSSSCISAEKLAGTACMRSTCYTDPLYTWASASQ